MERLKKYDYLLFIPVCIVLAFFIVVLTVTVYAAVTTPDVVDTIDYFGTEPFKGSDTIRLSTKLTTSYVNTDIVNLSDYSKVVLLFDYTKGSLTSMEYRIWVSYDNITWYVEATETVAAGLITDDPANYTTDDNENYFKLLNMYPPYLRLSVKGTGTVTNSLLAVHIVGVM